MALSAADVPCRAWLWQSAEGDAGKLNRDPAKLPQKWEEAAPALRDGQKGPRVAKLVPIKVLKLKDRAALIQEEGQEAQKAANANFILPWQEGLHLLIELEAHPMAADGGTVDWHLHYMTLLANERAKYANQTISAAAYVKRALLSVAATAPKVADAKGKMCCYRREVVKPPPLAEGRDENGFWRIREVVDYLPPWLAFCHPKCGVYQDHYLIRWAEPYTEVDYGMTETGWEDGVGCTWEPDECLPPCLDSLRVAAKLRWIKSTLQREEKAAALVRQEKAAAKVAAAASATVEEEPPFEEPDVANDDDDLPVAKRQKRGEDDPENMALWETVVSTLDFRTYVKDPAFVGEFGWKAKGGTVARQLMRCIDACQREKRVAVAWTVARSCIRAANEGPLSPRTRLATETACDLAKAKKVNLRTLEVVIGDLAKSVGPEASGSLASGAFGAVAWTLVHMFPQRKDVGWGWLHLGWSWSAWWDFVARCLQDFRPAQAFEILRNTLELMLSEAGPAVGSVRELPTWSDDPQRLKELKRRLCKTSGLEGPVLVKELDHLGIEEVAKA